MHVHVGLLTRSDVGYTLDLANDLQRTGASVTVYMCHEHTIREVGLTDRPAERLQNLGLLPPEVSVRLVRFPRRRDPRSFGVMRQLAQMLRADGIDVAHVLASPDDPWLAMLPGMVRGAAVVSTMIVPEPNFGTKLPWVAGFAFNWLLARGSDQIIVNGKDQVERVRQRYRLPANRVGHVPLSVRNPVMRWDEEAVDEEPGTILFFGAARPHKGLEYLVRAQPEISRQIPNARILISAHGEELKRCRALIRDHTKFEITDAFVPGDRASLTFQRASLVALPYLSASTSGVLMTAYSFAKPVVATRVGCLPEYVQDGDTGLLVPPADEGELAKAIIRLLSDNALRARMQRNISRWLDQRRASTADRTFEVYQKALVRRSSHHAR